MERGDPLLVLDAYRRQMDRLLVPVAERMAHVNPNLLSWLSLASAVGCGLSLALGGLYLIPALLLLTASALLDALDGKVARIAGRATLRGDFLDHALDRYSDLFILGGIIFSRYAPLPITLLALLGVLMTSYMGTQAQALGLGRMYGGALGRADRLVVILVAVALQAGLDPGGLKLLGVPPATFTFLGWAMLILALLGHLTAIQRGVRIWRSLSRSPPEN